VTVSTSLLAVSSNKSNGGPKSKSGIPGVSFHKASGKWIALVMLASGKRKYVGVYPTVQEAADARAAFVARHGVADPRTVIADIAIAAFDKVRDTSPLLNGEIAQ